MAFEYKLYDGNKQNEQRQLLKNILEKQKFVDTTFIIGPESKEYNVNRIFLAMISPVFEAMLFGKMKESSLDSDVIIEDIDPKHFECVLRFAYCQDPIITSDNVIALHQIADKYQIEKLTSWCLEYFKSLNATNVCSFLNQAILQNQAKIAEECMQFISKQTGEVVKRILASDSFKRMDVKSMKCLLKYDNLETNEDELWRNVIKWAEYQSKNKTANEEKHCDDSKEEFGAKLLKKTLLLSVYKCIRFGLMDGDFFAKHVLSENVLTKDEALSVFVYIHNHNAGCTHFNTRRRSHHAFGIDESQWSSTWPSNPGWSQKTTRENFSKNSNYLSRKRSSIKNL